MLGGLLLLLLLLPKIGPFPARGTMMAVPSGSAWHAPAAAAVAPAAMSVPASAAEMTKSMRPGSALQQQPRSENVTLSAERERDIQHHSSGPEKASRCSGRFYCSWVCWCVQA
jgi:hypothetical protein